MRTSTEVNMQEAEDIICSVGNKNAIHLEGRPGIGKTAMAENIAKRLDMRLLFMDGPNIDIAELGVPMPNHETGTSSMYPNERWGFHLGDPFLLFIDEFTKMARGAQNQVHPAINERRFGPFDFHPDVHVITTGNYSSDGANLVSMKGKDDSDNDSAQNLQCTSDVEYNTKFLLTITKASYADGGLVTAYINHTNVGTNDGFTKDVDVKINMIGDDSYGADAFDLFEMAYYERELDSGEIEKLQNYFIDRQNLVDNFQ